MISLESFIAKFLFLFGSKKAHGYRQKPFLRMESSYIYSYYYIFLSCLLQGLQDCCWFERSSRRKDLSKIKSELTESHFNVGRGHEQMKAHVWLSQKVFSPLKSALLLLPASLGPLRSTLTWSGSTC